MYLGSYFCLAGITFFGMGRNIWQWCIVALIGCSGMPVYQTYQTVILREKVPVTMQGRVFALQGVITEILTPLGYISGAFLADYVFEPFMAGTGRKIWILTALVGEGDGSGIGLIFVMAGVAGMVILTVLKRKLNKVLGA